MSTELKGRALLDYYREAVRARFGNEMAEKAILRPWYSGYRIGLPHYTPAGKLVARLPDFPLVYAPAEVREMAEELLREASSCQS